MISIELAFNDSPLLEDYDISYARHLRHKDNTMSCAEDLQVVRNLGDILVAVDGVDLAGKQMQFVLDLLSTNSWPNFVNGAALTNTATVEQVMYTNGNR